MKRRSAISFDFEIAYEIDGDEVRVQRENGEMTINGRVRATIGGIPIPDNVIIYYSGHSDTIETTVKRYAKAYARRNKKWKGDDADCSFDIQNAFSCGFLRNLLKDASLYDSNPNRKFIGLFDFDEAYNDWVQLGANLETNPTLCLAKKLNEREGYGLLLPVPDNPHIARQVVNPDTGGHYGGRSLLTIELLFHGAPILDAHFEVDQSRPERFIRFIGDKVHFAKEIVPGVPAEHFAAFEQIFRSVERIVGVD